MICVRLCFDGAMVFRVGLGVILVSIVGANILFANDYPPIRLSPLPFSATCDQTPVQNAVVQNIPIQNISIYTENWTWQLFPDGYIYPTYLAAVQNRLGGVANYDKELDWMTDITLGGRAPLIRYGNKSALYPEGWQLDMEGSVHLRMHLMKQMDMEANDFRFGLPLSYGTKVWQVRTGYYHVSSHMGDRRMIRYYDPTDPGDPVTGRPMGGWGDPAVPRTSAGMGTKYDSSYRVHYYREAWLLSYAIRPTPSTRLYAEVDYAFMLATYTKPWHFQFGAEWSPHYVGPSIWGTPFAAINARLMQEHNFDGNLTVQTGWQWRGSKNQLLRLGVQYITGISEQYEFIVGPREHKIGLGVWYDF